VICSSRKSSPRKPGLDGNYYNMPKKTRQILIAGLFGRGKVGSGRNDEGWG
jgi:hypothetical protein